MLFFEKQLSPYNDIIGVDVDKNNLTAYSIKHRSTCKVPNNTSGFEQIIGNFNLNKCKNNNKIIIIFEATGDYNLLAMKYFKEQGFCVKQINPILTKRFIKTTVRAKKTDISDAKSIALLFLQNNENCYEIDADTFKSINRKTALRIEQKLTHIQADLKRIKSSLNVKQQSGINVDSIISEINKLISELEKSSKTLWQTAKKDNENNIYNRQEQIIASHIGCGEKLSAIISTEAGNIKRFPSARQFKAYAGLDPKINQSGNKDIKGKITKRGNPILRQDLYLAAFTASRHDPELKIYYQKKRNEGKSHRHAICAVARKMCERIYATVVEDRLYVPRYPQEVV